jgi:hypothetical protein
MSNLTDEFQSERRQIRFLRRVLRYVASNHPRFDFIDEQYASLVRERVRHLERVVFDLSEDEIEEVF